MTFGDFLKTASLRQDQTLHIYGLVWTSDHIPKEYNIDVEVGDSKKYYELLNNETMFKCRYKIESMFYSSFNASWNEGKLYESIFIYIYLPRRIQKKMLKEGLV